MRELTSEARSSRPRGRTAPRSRGGPRLPARGRLERPRRPASLQHSRHACHPAASRAALPISSKRLIRVNTHPAPDAGNSSRNVSSSSQRNSITDSGRRRPSRRRSPRPPPHGTRTAAKRRPRAPLRCRRETRRSRSGSVIAPQTFSTGWASARRTATPIARRLNSSPSFIPVVIYPRGWGGWGGGGCVARRRRRHGGVRHILPRCPRFPRSTRSSSASRSTTGPACSAGSRRPSATPAAASARST